MSDYVLVVDTEGLRSQELAGEGTCLISFCWPLIYLCHKIFYEILSF